MQTEYITEQLKHQNTREYYEVVHEVAGESKYKDALEIGCCWGISTIATLTAGTGDLISVDKAGYDAPIKQVKAYNFGKRWKYIVMSSKNFLQNDKKMYDFIFIDGSHYYEDVKSDLELAWPRLKVGGVMLLDDYLHRYNKIKDYGVTKAVDEFCKANNLKPFIYEKNNGLVKITK